MIYITVNINSSFGWRSSQGRSPSIYYTMGHGERDSLLQILTNSLPTVKEAQ